MRFWDTMSMHIAISGMADHQRDLYKKWDNLPLLAKLYFSKPGYQDEGREIALELLTIREKEQLEEFKVSMPSRTASKI